VVQLRLAATNWLQAVCKEEEAVKEKGVIVEGFN
jgi:hypothetical protein